MELQTFLKRLVEVKSPTPRERELALYLERNYATLAFDDLESLSAKSGVSKATISRFIARLGYANFRTFLQTLRQHLMKEMNTSEKRFAVLSKSISPAESILHRHLNEVSSILQQTLAKIQISAFKRAVDLLSDSTRHLFILGSSTPGRILEGISVNFRSVRPNCSLLSDPVDIAIQIAQMPPDAVLLAVCITRFGHTAEKVLRHFHDCGCEVICIADSCIVPCFQYATVPLVIHVEGSSVFQTRCSALAVLESLLLGMLLNNGTSFMDRGSSVFSLMNELEGVDPSLEL